MVAKYKLLVTLFYIDREFIIEEVFENVSVEGSFFLFEDGNYACDCNRSLFIIEQYGDAVMPELDCGETIKLRKIRMEEMK